MNFKKNLMLLLVLVVAVLLVVFLERPFKKDAEQTTEKAGALFPALKIDEVKKLEIARPKEKNQIVLQRIDQTWYVMEAALPAHTSGGQAGEPQAKNAESAPPADKEAAQQAANPESFPADQAAVKEALEKLQSLREDNLASRNKDKHSLFEVSEGNAIQVAAYDSRGQELARLFVGKEGPDFFQQLHAQSWLLVLDIVYLHPDFLKGSFDRPLNNWRNRKIFDFAAADVSGLTITRKNETLALEKRDTGEWDIAQPVQEKAEGTKVARIVSSLSGLTAGKIADGVTLEQAGLKPPQAELAITFTDKSSRSLLVGAAKEKNFYYVTSGDQKYVYEASKSVIDALMPPLAGSDPAGICSAS